MLHLLVTNFAKGWSDHYSIKKGFEKIKIVTPPWFEIVWCAPKDSVSHGLLAMWGGVSIYQNEYKDAYCKCFVLKIIVTALNLLSMEDNKNSIAIR
jgi:hypothetical protein